MTEDAGSAVAYLWRHHRPAVSALGVALIVALFFAVRLTFFTVYWSDPAHHDQRIEGWMTPRYIARSWDVELDTIRSALPPLPEGGSGRGRPTLARIAADEGIPVDDLIEGITDAIGAARTE